MLEYAVQYKSLSCQDKVPRRWQPIEQNHCKLSLILCKTLDSCT